MNKRQYKKWLKKHFVTIFIPIGNFSIVNRNMRRYDLDQMVAFNSTYTGCKLLKNKYDITYPISSPLEIIGENSNEQGTME